MAAEQRMRERSIALVGLSGGGKSTVGQILARQLGWALADVDALIVELAGQPIDAIFAQYGEQHFRDLESAALAKALHSSPQVIATGAGLVLREQNRKLLREHALLIWLDAPDAVLLERLATADTERRPLLAHDPAERLRSLRAARNQIYTDLADYRIDSAAVSPELAAQQILQMYQKSEQTCYNKEQE